MSAYLTAAKKAEIAKQIRVPHKKGIILLLTEVTNAVAHDVADGIDVDFDAEVAQAITAADIPGKATTAVGLAVTAADIPGAVDTYLATKVSANVAELNQDTSAAYVEAEVQAIADKVDALIAALVAAGLMIGPI